MPINNLNSLPFDNTQMAELYENFSNFQPSEKSAIEEALENDENPVLDDIAHYKNYKSNQTKVEMFQRVFENEQNSFFQEHKRFMNAKEKKLAKSQIIKLIDKGLIFVNDIGQIQSRKSNYTAPTKKRRK